VVVAVDVVAVAAVMVISFGDRYLAGSAAALLSFGTS
jgi:hypothetical protein